MQTATYYQIIGISPESDMQTLEKAINDKLRELQKLINIGSNRQKREETQHTIKKIFEIKKILLDPQKRADYDKKIKESICRKVDFPGEKVELDDRGRIVSILSNEGRKIHYTYDEAGNLHSIEDTHYGTIRYEFDSIDRLIKETYPQNRTISHAYDAAGNRTKLVYPDGKSVEYTYDALHHLVQINTDNHRTEITYNKSGTIQSEQLPNGIRTEYHYQQKSGKLETILIKHKSGKELFRFHYRFDAVGNCLEAGQVSENGKNTFVYRYDRIYQLIEARNSNGFREKYTYNALGDRIVKHFLPETSNGILNKISGLLLKKKTYTYDRKIHHLVKAGTITYTCDDEGNLIEKNSRGRKTHYRFSSNNLLTGIDFPDGSWVRYYYDYRGRRVKKEFSSGRIMEYLYDGQDLIQEADKNGTITACYIYGNKIDHPVMMIREGNTYYYLFDYLGNVIALADENGAIAAEYNYDPWGCIIGENPAKDNRASTNVEEGDRNIENPFRFTGREWDKESGLYYYRKRYYDPETGRFISKDPFPGFPGERESLNRYCYVNNNPATLIDPMGLYPYYSYDPMYYVRQEAYQMYRYLQNQYYSAVNTTKNFISNTWNSTVNFMSNSHVTALADGFVDTAAEMFRQGTFVHLHNYMTNSTPGLTNYLNSLGRAARWGKGMGWAGNAFNIYDGALNAWQGNYIDAAFDFIKIPLTTQGSIVGIGLGVKIGAALGIVGGPAGVLCGITGGLILGYAVNKGLDLVESGVKVLSDKFQNYMTKNPDVGGVLFDQSATVLTDLEEITGAYWDEELGQLVLAGTKNGSEVNRYLPRMDKDHLAVALRAVFSGDNLGVSIDTPPGYEQSGAFPPAGTLMPVRYLGNTKDTLFGTILFEADKLLKNLSMGIDNTTGKVITSHVKDFQNELDISFQLKKEKKNAWSRMWFVIEDMRLEMDVRETADRNSLYFGKATMKVKAEYLSQAENPGSDPVSEKFAGHFTLHYDDFAGEFPVLERLKELAKIAAIAKWLKESGKPVDLTFLDEYDFIKVPTPDVTPGIIASKSKSESWQEGTTVRTHTQTYSLYGGVDFDFTYYAGKDTGEAIALRTAAQKGKPCESSMEWDIDAEKGKPGKAIVLPITGKKNSHTDVHTDYSLSITGELTLELSRVYNSFHRKPSLFGFGWELYLPYKIHVINPRKKNSPLLLINMASQTSEKYMYNHLPEKIRDTVFKEDILLKVMKKDDKDFLLSAYILSINNYQLKNTLTIMERKRLIDILDSIEYRRAYYLVVHEKGTAYSYDPGNFIQPGAENNFVWKSDKGIVYTFDAGSRLKSKTDTSGKGIYYTYDDDNIKELSGPNGRKITITYDNRNRVIKASAPDNTIIKYHYNQEGDLINVLINNNSVRAYTCDSLHRVTMSFDKKRKVKTRSNYDLAGRVIKKKQDRIAVNSDIYINREYNDDCLLIKEEDHTGNKKMYEYDNDRNLVKSILINDKDRKIMCEHDEEERITKIKNQAGHTITLGYDDRNNISIMTDPNGNKSEYQYDNGNNLVRIKDALQNIWRQEFDSHSNMTALTDPAGKTINFEYCDNDLLHRITLPEGEYVYRYNNKKQLEKLIDPEGNATEFFYTANGVLDSIKNAAGTTYVLHDGVITAVRDRKGRTIKI
ncbi:MAG: hypothetical protein JXB88_11440 [Spirochaetales bacterium]|nr:hypothetical protein [Spirochaetales bacterium]